MKKFFALFLCLVLFFSACSSAPSSADGECVKITVRDYGEIVVELYPDAAPETVENFKKLVREGFYTGVLFHRVVKDFVIQAGEPAPGKAEAASIKGEFQNNGVANPVSHTRGVISMARNPYNYNSASSQFFICHRDSPSLDGDYAAFGKVIAGMDVVDKIAAVETDSNDKPVTDVVIEKAELIARDLVAAKTAETAETAAETGDAAAYKKSETETDLVRIDVKGYGSIVVELYPDTAPETVRNFKKLVGQGFYNGLIFHRVIENFMIQGGDPNGTGTGGPGWTIKGEFSKNGVDNPLKHTRGVISMARQGNPYNDAPYYNTAGSQFFICHKDVPSLDGSYAAFGKVVAGMDAVDKIAAVETGANDKPVNDVVMSEVYFVTGE